MSPNRSEVAWNDFVGPEEFVSKGERIMKGRETRMRPKDYCRTKVISVGRNIISHQ